MASLRPSPVMVLTPLLGDAATTSWPPCRRRATAFEPIRPVPPMTTIFMVLPLLSMTDDPWRGSNGPLDVAEQAHNPLGCLIHNRFRSEVRGSSAAESKSPHPSTRNRPCRYQ